MRAKHIAVLLVSVFLISSIPAEAQLFREYVKSKKERAKDRAADKADDKVDQKVDEGVDKVFEGFSNMFKSSGNEDDKDEENENSGEETQNSNENPGFSMFSGGGDVDLPDAYTFDYKVDMVTTLYDENGNEEEQMPSTMLFPSKGSYMGTTIENDGQSIMAVMDFDEEVMVSLVSGRAIVINLSQYTEQAEAEMEESSVDEDFSIEKTGRTKTIAGYTCDEYKMNSETTEGTAWFAQDADFSPFQNFVEKYQKLNPQINMGDINGFPMESTTIDKETNEKTHLLVTNVAKESKTINMKDYEVMDLGSFGGGGNK